MRVQCTCLRCGVDFSVPAAWAKRGEGKFCSRDCRRGYATGPQEPRPGIPQADGTILVPLTKGKFATIDTEDAERILTYRWCFADYAWRGVPLEGGGQRQIGMHNVVLPDCPEGMRPDHIDGNRLNNRRSNLRCATNTQNRVNSKLSRNNSHGFRGVVQDKRDGAWYAKIVIGGKARYFPRVDTPEEAARMYDAAAREAFGEFARLNYPD